MNDTQDAPFICCAECKGEVYQYGILYTWTKQVNGEPVTALVCESCFEELFNDQGTDEKAALIGSEKFVVGGTV